MGRLPASTRQLPERMRAIELRAYNAGDDGLSLVEKPVPAPGRGQVLVRIGAAPINPSDLAFLRGLYGIKKRLPVVPGLEGSGEVVGAGGGLLPRLLLGRRVACAAPPGGDGTWAEYMVTPASHCIPLRRGVGLEAGAMMLVNPLTAWALVRLAEGGGHRAIVQTAAASALGRMVSNLCRRNRLPLVNVVRRREQVELLEREHGARHVLVSGAPDFDDRLAELCRRLGVTVAFDAVAGEMTGRLLGAVGDGGRVIVYGALSGAATAVDPRAFIFGGKRVEGFWLPRWIERQNALRLLWTARRVQGLLASDLRTQVQARVPLAAATRGLAQYVSDMSRGKVILLPGAEQAAPAASLAPGGRSS